MSCRFREVARTTAMTVEEFLLKWRKDNPDVTDEDVTILGIHAAPCF